MKTVIDAVNALNGDLEFANQGDSGYQHLVVDILNGSYWLSSMGKSSVEFGKLYSYICTVGEFNACVGELSAATWINGLSLEEWKAGMKNTVIDSNGNELELNKVYEFSDDGLKWFPSALVRLVDHEYQYNASNARWMTIRECQSPLGTIKKAPVKLIDGKAYQFESNGSVCIGIFDGENLQDNNRIYMPRGCTNIITLVPETK